MHYKFAFSCTQVSQMPAHAINIIFLFFYFCANTGINFRQVHLFQYGIIIYLFLFSIKYQCNAFKVRSASREVKNVK